MLNQINFCLILLLKAEKTPKKKLSESYSNKKKKIKHSNILKNKTHNFILIHIN
jgi:hypothetical protein